jgi:uncharacterized protein YkwD
MKFAPGDIRFVTALLAAIVVALLLAPGVTAQASANPCKRWGDVRPSNITAKGARAATTCLINKERNQHGRGDLNRNSRLNEAARNHSSHMESKGCFSHQCSGERSLLSRLKAVRYITDGLSRWAYGENIAYGDDTRGTPRAMVNAWMNSSEHRANMLSGTFRDVGVGFARDGRRGYYTADFGMRQG